MNALVDWVVGEMRVALERNGILDNTILIFTSDNGPRRGANGHQSAGPFRGYKNSAYEGGHRVPFIVRWPGKVAAGERSEVPISLTDMIATFAEFADYDLPDHAAEDSYTILPAFFGKETEAMPRPALISDTSFGDFSVRSGSWKLVQLNPSPRNQLEQVEFELYDMDQDPYETTNLSDVYPEKVKELKQLLDETGRTGLRFLNRP
jgi:arylsulfatase A-like enzyme